MAAQYSSQKIWMGGFLVVGFILGSVGFVVAQSAKMDVKGDIEVTDKAGIGDAVAVNAQLRVEGGDSAVSAESTVTTGVADYGIWAKGPIGIQAQSPSDDGWAGVFLDRGLLIGNPGFDSPDYSGLGGDGDAWIRGNVEVDLNTIIQGFLGIGTISPGGKLEVVPDSSGTGTGIVLRDTGDSSNLALIEDSGSGQGRMVLRGGGTDKVLFTSNGDSYLMGGKLGVGISSPDAEHKIHAKGRILLENGANTTGTARNEGLSLWTDEAFGLELHYSNSSWQTALFGRKSDNTALTFGAYDTNETAQQDFYHYLTIKNTGYVGIGTESPGSKLDVRGTTGNSITLDLLNDGSNTHTGVRLMNANTAPNSYTNLIEGQQARGSLASADPLQSGDYIFGLQGALYADDSYQSNVGMYFRVDGAPAAGDYPTRISFETTADSSSTRTERMRITNDGKIAIGSGALSIPPEKLAVDGYVALRTQTGGDPGTSSFYSKLYSKGVITTEMYTMDSSGNVTQQTSHKDPRVVEGGAMASFGDPTVQLPFSFHHSNVFIGKGAVVDLAAVIKDLETATGKTYTYIYDITPEEIVDYVEWRTEEQARLELEAREKILAETPEIEISIEDAFVEVPEVEVVEQVQEYSEYVYDLGTLSVHPATFEHIVRVEVPTGNMTRELKDDVRFETSTGKFYRWRKIEEIQIAQIPAPRLPQWIIDRLPPSQ